MPETGANKHECVNKRKPYASGSAGATVTVLKL